MKRFKTKQELKDGFKNGSIAVLGSNLESSNGYSVLKSNGSFGIPVKDNLYNDVKWLTTTDPHPFDSMDIKVRVTPEQSKKLQKKAFKMGYAHARTEHIDYNNPFLYLYSRKCIGFGHPYEESYFNNHLNIELTYRQFINGTVPKKKDAITADEIIKPEVMERLNDVTTLSIKACKSIKEVQEAYIQLQETIKN